MDKKVILISIDGLRPDAVETCGHPFVNTLRENGCYSPDASSVVPPVTLPAHTSIFYSVPPTRHGIITNDYMPPVRPIRGLAEQLERADKTCAAFYGWEPMRHVWTSGNMKYSLFVNEYEEDNSDLLLTQEAHQLAPHGAGALFESLRFGIVARFGLRRAALGKQRKYRKHGVYEQRRREQRAYHRAYEFRSCQYQYSQHN